VVQLAALFVVGLAYCGGCLCACYLISLPSSPARQGRVFIGRPGFQRSSPDSPILNVRALHAISSSSRPTGQCSFSRLRKPPKYP